MSAESFVFYGLRFTVAPEEVEAMERRTDGRLRAARDVGLKSYWGNFSDGEDRHMLLIGFQLGALYRSPKFLTILILSRPGGPGSG